MQCYIVFLNVILWFYRTAALFMWRLLRLNCQCLYINLFQVFSTWYICWSSDILLLALVTVYCAIFILFCRLFTFCNCFIKLHASHRHVIILVTELPSVITDYKQHVFNSAEFVCDPSSLAQTNRYKLQCTVIGSLNKICNALHILITVKPTILAFGAINLIWHP